MFGLQSAVGLSLGNEKIDALELVRQGRSAVVRRLLSIDSDELRDAHVPRDDLSEVVPYVKRRMQAAGIPTRRIVLGIDQNVCMLRYAQVAPAPTWRLELIMKFETDEIMERMGEPVVSSYRLLSVRRNVDDDQVVLLSVAKENELANRLKILEANGMMVKNVVPHALALFHAAEVFGEAADEEAEDDDVRLYLDIGKESIDTVLTVNERLAFARSMSFGGAAFTRILADSLEIDESRAERLKCERGGLDTKHPNVLEDTVSPLRNAAGQLLNLIQSTMKMAATQHGRSLQPLSHIFLSGGGAQLRGLDAFLSQSMKVSVKRFAPFGHSAGAAARSGRNAAVGADFDAAVALGLAVTGLDHSGEGSFVLLPHEYRRRRLFRERTLFLYLAAAFLVLLVGARFLHGFLRGREANHVLAENTRVHTELVGKKRSHDENLRKESAARARLNRILIESEVSAFQGFVLDYLGRELPAEVQVESLALEEHGVQVSEREYVLRVAGRVNNERRQALKVLRRFQQDLLASERIGAVDITSSTPLPGGAWYGFEVEIRPNYVRY